MEWCRARERPRDSSRACAEASPRELSHPFGASPWDAPMRMTQNGIMVEGLNQNGLFLPVNLLDILRE